MLPGPLGGGRARGGWDPGQFDRNGALIPEVAHSLSAQPQLKHREDADTLIPEVAHCICGGPDGHQFGSGRDGQDTFIPIAFDPIPFDTTQLCHPANHSSPKPGAPCHPLGALQAPPAIAFQCHGSNVGPMGTLRAGNGNEAGGVPFTVAHTLRGEGFDASEDGTGRGTPMVPAGMAVRRLTPRECERLQGFPDDYTAIPGAKDGPRYRALGNSMAVPVMSWIGRRIQMVEDALRSSQEAA
jgi:DNA (cytosine-5)-methyltransferase 1